VAEWATRMSPKIPHCQRVQRHGSCENGLYSAARIANHEPHLIHAPYPDAGGIHHSIQPVDIEGNLFRVERLTRAFFSAVAPRSFPG